MSNTKCIDNSSITNLGTSLLIKEWFAAGASNAFTSALLNPLDVAKTRIQTNAIYITKSSPKGHLLDALTTLYREGGIIGLYSPGLKASVLREMISSGCRAGLYVPLRDSLCMLLYSNNTHVTSGSSGSSNGSNVSNSNILFIPKLLASLITGCCGSFLANPIDLIKIRMMSQTCTQSNSSSILGMSRAIVSKEGGITALYKGIAPSTLRAMLISAGELGSYDIIKTLLKSKLYANDSNSSNEAMSLHIASSMLTGIVAATVAAPFDVVKSRSMNSTIKVSSYHILNDICRNEGVRYLLKGWLPSYMRLGPHAVICFPLFEYLRSTFGLSYL